ncbi:MAG: 2Fe-2S iron-sulfur cluster-binding protein, partial [Pseudomonadota bacterium]
MSHRLEKGGRLVDRGRVQSFRFNGRAMRGYQGDTLASALLANGQMLVGRSFKYHRPRGIVASGAEEPNALVNLGRGKTFEPNARATTTELFDGLEAESQNHWPSLEFDVGEINARLSRFLPAGFYYKMFLWPRAFWKHVYEPFIRQSAGLGKAPKNRDADHYEHMNVHVDVLVIGGGIAGIEAAEAAADGGADVMLVEQTATWGGRAPVDGHATDEDVAARVAALAERPNVRLRLRTMGAGVYDHGYVLAYERLTDHAPDASRPRHRLWRIRAGKVVTATGAIERPLSFAGNDLPGVMLAGAVRDYVVNYGVAPGRRTVVVTNNDDGYRTALALKAAGLEVPAVLDARAEATGPLASEAREAGIDVRTGRGIKKVEGKGKVQRVWVCDQTRDGSNAQSIICDCVAMSGGWSPVVHLWSHCGGKLTWDEAGAFFRPDPERAPTGADGAPFVAAVGAANGDFGEGEQPMLPVWNMPAEAGYDLRSKSWLDYQNDVKVTDVELAAREGFESVEHTKRYTTLGMATDQGKLSNINGLAVLAQQLGEDIPAVGTTTFRPPYTP